jgi:hypothetical protein
MKAKGKATLETFSDAEIDGKRSECRLHYSGRPGAKSVSNWP